jgi:uncharacterized membrane protein
MTSANALSADQPIFSVLLRPYRSLGTNGLVLVMVVLSAMSSAIGIAFWLIGAWPVVGFLGLDVALLYLAFRLNNRAALAAEEISVTRRLLRVRKIAADGRRAEAGFDPYWARLEIDRHPEFGVTSLRIASHGKRLGIATFLAPRQRESLAASLKAALAVVRSTPPA